MQQRWPALDRVRAPRKSNKLPDGAEAHGPALLRRMHELGGAVSAGGVWGARWGTGEGGGSCLACARPPARDSTTTPPSACQRSLCASRPAPACGCASWARAAGLAWRGPST